MYFPYLYGRRAEFLALREIATAFGNSIGATPVIEPVKSDPRDLFTALQIMNDRGLHSFVISNPSHGDFISPAIRDAWWDRVSALVGGETPARIAYEIASPDDAAGLPRFLKAHGGEDIGVVVRSADVPPARLAALLKDQSALVFVHQSANPSAYARLVPAGIFVEVENCFNAQQKNADYSGEEWFTSSNLDFANAGHPGFSDFGPLPNAYSEGGGQIGAAVIHLSFRSGHDGSIWVQHFVSDLTRVDEGDQKTKMLQAAGKLHDEVDGNTGKFDETFGLRALLAKYHDSESIGLMTNKQLQLIHHIITAANSMGE